MHFDFALKTVVAGAIAFGVGIFALFISRRWFNQGFVPYLGQKVDRATQPVLFWVRLGFIAICGCTLIISSFMFLFFGFVRGRA